MFSFYPHGWCHWWRGPSEWTTFPVLLCESGTARSHTHELLITRPTTTRSTNLAIQRKWQTACTITTDMQSKVTYWTPEHKALGQFNEGNVRTLLLYIRQEILHDNCLGPKSLVTSLHLEWCSTLEIKLRSCWTCKCNITHMQYSQNRVQ